MTGFYSDRELREVLPRILPSLDDAAADWQDVLARAGRSADPLAGRQPIACEAGARRLPSPESSWPGSGRRRPSGARDRRWDRSPERQGPSPEDQGWGTRPIDRYPGAHGLELLPEALGWGTRPI